MKDRPQTRYVKTSDGVHIGYQVYGAGPLDLVISEGYISNIDAAWDLPVYAEFQSALARRARVIAFDRRGTGVSDRPTSPDKLALEKGMDDLGTVLDAVGSERAVIYGRESGAAVGLLYAAAHPDRTLGLVLHTPQVAYWQTPDFPWGFPEAFVEEWVRRIGESWGTADLWRWNLDGEEPGRAFTDDELEAWARWSRLCASPGAALAADLAERDLDVRSLLPHVHVPTLVLLVEGDKPLFGAAPWIAQQIPGARYRELPGNHHWPRATDTELFVELDRFLADIREEQSSFDRVLATVLFTDIVDSTATAATMGDAGWRRVVDDHDRLIRGLVARYRGTYVRSTGDGVLATFDGPARGVRCAEAIVDAVRSLGIEVRAGLHTGEIEHGGADLAGVGVHIGARVGALAGPGEVWASSTVKELTAGSGLTFEDRGTHELKGVPDPWHLYRVRI
jgi:class 3 adenylate cyclase